MALPTLIVRLHLRVHSDPLHLKVPLVRLPRLHPSHRPALYRPSDQSRLWDLMVPAAQTVQ